MTAMTDEARKAALRKAYGTATQDLRENHRDEFNDLYAERAKELGVEWSPRQTPEQRAEQAFDALLADYPHLAERIAKSA
jgi:hypothetical protein